jgi:DNA repair protein RadD
VSIRAGDFQQDELADAMDLPQITGDIVKTWLERREDRPTLAYRVNRKHARHVAECFLEVGVAAEYMDGLTQREDREATFMRFATGETRVIVNVGVLTMGIDVDARCVIDAKPTKSKMLFCQTIGHGLRTAEGKANCIILDHAGDHLRLGLVTDLGEEQLNDGSERQNGGKEREKSDPLPCLCKSCKAVMPRSAKVCQACGEAVAVASLVRVATGELVELGSRQSGRGETAEWEKKVFFSELQGAKKPHYKLGWPAMQFRNRFGYWPPNHYDDLPTPSPSLSTRNWLKSRQIAFAKRRAG